MLNSAPFLFYKGRLHLKNVIIFALVLFLQACGQSTPPLELVSGKTMGTTYTLKFTYGEQAGGKAVSKAEIEKAVSDELLQVNALMSTYIEDSELSRLNKTPANTPFKMSEETTYVINEALRINNLSEGMLDITVGPLVNLWGFGPQSRPEILPSEEDLALVSTYVGVDKFSINGNVVNKAHNKVYIDLSTIAKGYAVDRIALILEKRGITNYLVEIGGEMRLSGTKPNNQQWLVAIEKPSTTERSAQSVISIGNNAIASSGDYRNYFEDEGVRYSHLIDPSTGAPIQHNLVSVSVVAKSCMTADGLATALIVLGKERGFTIAEKNNIAALFITKEGEDFVEYPTSAYNAQVNVIKAGNSGL